MTFRLFAVNSVNISLHFPTLLKGDGAFCAGLDRL